MDPMGYSWMGKRAIYYEINMILLACFGGSIVEQRWDLVALTSAVTVLYIAIRCYIKSRKNEGK